MPSSAEGASNTCCLVKAYNVNPKNVLPLAEACNAVLAGTT